MTTNSKDKSIRIRGICYYNIDNYQIRKDGNNWIILLSTVNSISARLLCESERERDEIENILKQNNISLHASSSTSKDAVSNVRTAYSDYNIQYHEDSSTANTLMFSSVMISTIF